MRAVLDTSPLQAFWRAGILDRLRLLFDAVAVPTSVADETRWSLELVGSDRVPDLAAHPWIRAESVPSGVLAPAMALLFDANHKRSRGEKVTHAEPEIEVVADLIIASSGPGSRLTFKIPDLEVVLLAKRASAVAIMDDKKALRSALDLGVRTATTREVVNVMMARGLISDAKSAVERMRTAGYHPTVRSMNAWDGTG